MTAIFERIKGEVKDLTIEEIQELIRELLRRRTFLGLDAEIDGVEAMLALVAFIKEKIALLPPGDKERMVQHLRHGQASEAHGQSAICAHCWSPLPR